MEVALCAQEVSNRAVLQMARLNLQRKQDQFCDCVLRLRDNPGQLHPAHRCVLAASSPVLASMLSSAGVLVELQAPYFSESVLPPLLDYLYTGSIPHNQIQQQHRSLLIAACYLQMDELIEALRACQTEFAENVIESAGDETLPHEDMDTKTADNFCDMRSASCISAFGSPEEMHSSSTRSKRNLPEKHAHQYTSNMEAFKETSVHIDSSKDMETSANRIDTKHSVNYGKETSNASTSSEAGVGCSVLKSIKSKAKHHWIPQDFIRNVPSPAEVNDIANMDKEAQEDMLYSLERVKSGIWQEDMDEDRRSSSTVSQYCCGAVPVIRHSSKTAVQLAQVPHHQPVSQASPRLGRTSVLQITNVNNDNTAEGIIAEHKIQLGAQEQMPERHNENQTGTLSQDQKEGLNQCVTEDMCDKSTGDRSAQLEQAHKSIHPDKFIRHNDECPNNGSSLVNIQHAHCDALQNKTEYPQDDSVLQNKKTDFYNFSSKYKQQNNSDSYSLSMEKPTEEPSLNLRHSAPPETHCEDCIPEQEVQREHSYSSRSAAKMDVQVSQCSIYVPDTNRLSNICWAERSKKDATSIRQKCDSPDAATENKGHANLFPPVPSLDNNTGHTSTECHTSMEPDKIITEPQLTFTMSVDSNMGDSMYNAISQKYQGHLHYHYLPDEDSHLSCSHCDKKCSQAHFNLSDRSGDEEEACTSAYSGLSPLKYHDAMEATEQVFLLDISTKPAELLVSCRRISDSEGEVNGQRDTFITGLTNTDKRTPADEDRTMPGADKAETVEELSCFKPGDNQISSGTVSSPASMSNSVQASMPSTMSVSGPSSLSASMPKNVSTHQPSPINHSFQCTLCDRSFSQRGSLNRHVRSHLGVRPFPCPRCPMTFSRQYRVTEHMRVHQRCVFGNGLQKQPNSSI